MVPMKGGQTRWLAIFPGADGTANLRYWLGVIAAIGLSALLDQRAHADELTEYAKLCDQRIQASVLDFDCESGTLIPVTNQRGNSCDRPNRLNEECDPGSYFKVLKNDATASIVALCRKEGAPEHQYKDIAVIQYNPGNGATCFYQKLSKNGMSKDVKAPLKGLGTVDKWLSPSQVASPTTPACVACHDNGPLIRSPYLTQIEGKDALPGAGNLNFNKDQPYVFVGRNLASWQAYKVEIGGNECTTKCHRLGVSNMSQGKYGTALDFGIRSTAKQETAKNPVSDASPLWMLPAPPQTTYDAANANLAQAVRDCALAFLANQRNTNPKPGCTVSPFTSAYVPSGL
jgi:hypothetical protein